MLNTFIEHPSRVTTDQDLDDVYGQEAAYQEGTEADDFEVNVKGIQGMGLIGEMFDEYERFLDIKVFKNGNVEVTVRNRQDTRDVRESWPTVEEIALMPVTSASVLLNPEGKTALFAEAFAKIARRAAAAIQRDIDLYNETDDEYEEESDQ